MTTDIDWGRISVPFLKGLADAIRKELPKPCASCGSEPSRYADLIDLYVKLVEENSALKAKLSDIHWSSRPPLQDKEVVYMDHLLEEETRGEKAWAKIERENP